VRTSLLLAIISVSIASGSTKYGGGTGEPNDPYLIYTPEQMNAIGAEPNDWTKCFKLVADIDLSEYTDTQFNVIGSSRWPDGRPFTGVFDGNGHVLSNLTLGANDAFEVALFGFVGDPAESHGYTTERRTKIKNLTLLHPSVHSSANDTAALVAWLAYGEIANCRVEGANVSGAFDVGILVGRSTDGIIATSCATGAISGHSDYYCYVGGLVGYNYGRIMDCYSTATITGETCAGGLVGVNSFGGTIARCYSTGRVTRPSYYDYSGQAGGLVGSGDGAVVASYWNTQTSGRKTSVGGWGKSTSEMRKSATFVGWSSPDGNPLWTIDEDKDYPRLRWENGPGRSLTGRQLRDALEGTGSEDDPFVIRTAEELNTIGQFPYDWDKHFRLTADVDLGQYGGTAFNIIGTFRLPFTGRFDGGHHTVSNLNYADTGRSFVGLFGSVVGAEAEIKNIALRRPMIGVPGGYCLGSLVGYLEGGKVTGCSATNVGLSVSDNTYAGGLVGYNAYGSVTGCRATVAICACYRVGGIVGENDGLISDCQVQGTICGEESVGGITGINWSMVKDSYAEADVMGPDYIGGLVGRNYAAITACRSSGVTVGATRAGGLVGYNASGRLTNCYTTSTVLSGSYGGGVAGMNDGVIMNCYAVSSVGDCAAVGGLVGLSGTRGTVLASFWDTDVSGQPASAGGVGKTTTQMQSAGTFEGWGCEGAWRLDEGRDYPRLSWENKTGAPITTPGPISIQGTGSEAAPYLIYTSDDFIAIAYLLSTWDKHFKLMADIDLSAYPNFSINIIGLRDSVFRGVFDGNHHTISNFTWDLYSEDPVGLFACMDGPNAVIKDLGLVNVKIEGLTAAKTAGSLVANLVEGSITRCYATGKIADGEDIGGLVGTNSNGTIADCYVRATVSGYAFTGGLIGLNGGTILRCYAATCADDETLPGGLIGYCPSGSVVASFWDTQASGQSTSAGGIGKTTTEMKQAHTFVGAGWDFVGETANGTEDIWRIDEGKDYPHLSWEPK
jgi:hypothetical protein